MNANLTLVALVALGYCLTPLNAWQAETPLLKVKKLQVETIEVTGSILMRHEIPSGEYTSVLELNGGEIQIRLEPGKGLGESRPVRVSRITSNGYEHYADIKYLKNGDAKRSELTVCAGQISMHDASGGVELFLHGPGATLDLSDKRSGRLVRLSSAKGKDAGLYVTDGTEQNTVTHVAATGVRTKKK